MLIDDGSRNGHQPIYFFKPINDFMMIMIDFFFEKKKKIICICVNKNVSLMSKSD